MLNIIKADLYRIFRGKTLYITFIAFLFLMSLQVVFPESGSFTIGVSNDGIPGLDALPKRSTCGLQAPIVLMSYADQIIYFMLSIIYIISATDFSYGAIKNSLCSGVSRVKFYLSKLVLTIILSFVMYITGILIVSILSTIFNGLGGTLTGEYISYILKAASSQFLLLTAAVCIGTAIIFITKKGSALTSIYLTFFLGISFIIFMLAELGSLDFLVKYDFLSNLKMLSVINNMETVDIIRALSIGFGFTIISTFFGILSFKKSEIK